VISRRARPTAPLKPASTAVGASAPALIA
jgi:hypothetical protein